MLNKLNKFDTFNKKAVNEDMNIGWIEFNIILAK